MRKISSMKTVERDVSLNSWNGKKVFLVFLSFFAVCSVVNAFFVYMAVTTHWGTVAKNPYEQGLHYNEILEQARSRKHENLGTSE